MLPVVRHPQRNRVEHGVLTQKTIMAEKVKPRKEGRAKPVASLVPEGFRPESILPERLRFRCDDASWFVGQIVRKTRQGMVDRHGFARLHERVLRRVMSERTLAAVIGFLRDAGIVEQSEYRIGQYSRGYRLGPAWADRKCHRLVLKDPRLTQRVAREVERLEDLHVSRYLPIHHDLNRMHELLTVEREVKRPIAVIPEVATRRRQHTLLWQIEQHRPGRRSITGRWFSPFTGTKRTLRSHFRFDGQPLGGYDIRCAQPAILAVAMGTRLTQFLQCVGTYSNSAAPCSLPVAPLSSPVLSVGLVWRLFSLAPACDSDLGLFSELARSALLYPFLLDCCRRDGVDLTDLEGRGRSKLDMVKVLSLQDVLAKKGVYSSDFERVFCEAFPTVHRAVRWINSRQSPSDGSRNGVHGKLIRALQRLESALVIETVCPVLAPRIPILPLHDCLFGRLSDMGEIKAGFEEVFARCGVWFGLKRDVPIQKVT